MSRLTAAVDASAADWIVAGVRDFGGTVGSVVPAVFDAYARVFHPAQRGQGDNAVDVRWADVAEANGRVMHPAAEWGSLVGSWQLEGQDCLWDAAPSVGELPLRVAKILARVLARQTADPARCLLAPSAMRGTLGLMFAFPVGTPVAEEAAVREAHEARLAERERVLESAPRFSLPEREFRLFEGPLAGLEELYEQLDEHPDLWWPADRAWCVGTDLDLMTTYVGGSRACIEALVADERLEVLPVSDDQSVTWEADAVNPRPGPPN